MKYDLDASNEKYIKVTVSGIVDKSNLVAAMSDLMQHSEYIQKHSFWDFYDSTIGLTIGDLKELAGVLKLYKPKIKEFANKSAIVVPGEMHKAMVGLFITMTKMLPFEYKVFNDKEKAEAFLYSK